MGKGPKQGAAQETSRRGSLSERMAAVEGGASAHDVSAAEPDPCREDVEISITPDGANAAVGDPLWLIPGTPPHAATAAGVIGTVQRPEADRLEACIRVGISFTGVATSVYGTVIGAVVHGE